MSVDLGTESVLLLSKLNSGQKFRINRIRAKGEIRRRLIDMGFVRDERGVVLREALLRDPIELAIKGTNVSVRRSEAELIEIEAID